MDQKNQTAEKLAEQVRAKLLEELLDALKVGEDLREHRLVNLEAAAHVLNALDPARAGVGSYACGILKAEKIEEPAK